MEGPIKKSVIERLPSAIKGLNETAQKVYIYLRLRKSEDEISKKLNLSHVETSSEINAVRNELATAGQLDLIEDPHFLSIHSEDPDNQDMPLASGELDIDERLAIKEFLSCLKDSIHKLPQFQSRLLKLRYKHQLSAKDILGFSRKIEIDIIHGKEITGLNEQDIFYALNTALKDVFNIMKKHCLGESPLKITGLKYIIEEIGV